MAKGAAVSKLLGLGTKVGGGATVIGAIGATGYYMADDGTIWDATGNLVEDINKALGEGGARAEAEAAAEGLYAFLEQVGEFVNNVFGGTAGLGLINWARDAQTNQKPLVYTADGLKEIEEVTASLNPTPTVNAGLTPTVGAPAVAPAEGNIDVTNDFGLKTEYSNYGTYETQATFSDRFQEAAIDLGVELDEDLTAEQAIEVAMKADPLSADEWNTVLADDISKGLFQQAYDVAKEGSFFSSYTGNITNFFQQAHDNMVRNEGIELSAPSMKVTLGLGSS